jgi:hypothetical protein
VLDRLFEYRVTERPFYCKRQSDNSIGYVPPAEYEARYYEQAAVA